MARLYAYTSYERYCWPRWQLSIWIIGMLAAAVIILGIFAEFINIQKRMELDIPWVFPFGVSVGAITIAILLGFMFLVMKRKLLPVIVLTLSFILFALFLTGLVGTALQLFGPNADVHTNCQIFVFNNDVTGPNANTLVWIAQNTICSSWMTVFAFWIIGAVLLVWMIMMASKVQKERELE